MFRFPSLQAGKGQLQCRAVKPLNAWRPVFLQVACLAKQRSLSHSNTVRLTCLTPWEHLEQTVICNSQEYFSVQAEMCEGNTQRVYPSMSGSWRAFLETITYLSNSSWLRSNFHLVLSAYFPLPDNGPGVHPAYLGILFPCAICEGLLFRMSLMQFNTSVIEARIWTELFHWESIMAGYLSFIDMPHSLVAGLQGRVPQYMQTWCV